jgi:hypothetical protein
LITQSLRPELCDAATLRTILPDPMPPQWISAHLRESAQLSPQPKIGLVEETNLSKHTGLLSRMSMIHGLGDQKGVDCPTAAEI